VGSRYPSPGGMFRTDGRMWVCTNALPFWGVKGGYVHAYRAHGRNLMLIDGWDHVRTTEICLPTHMAIEINATESGSRVTSNGKGVVVIHCGWVEIVAEPPSAYLEPGAI